LLSSSSSVVGADIFKTYAMCGWSDSLGIRRPCSEAAAANVFLCESEAAATKRLAGRKSTTRYNEKKDQLSSGESATGYFYIDIVL